MNAKRRLGKLVHKLRRQRRWSMREMAAKSGIPHPSLSLLEHGRKAVGPKLVERLASAFELSGSERAEFLNLALECSVCHRLTVENANYPAWLLNWVPTALKQAGIRAEGFEVDHIAPKSVLGVTDENRNLLIEGDAPGDNWGNLIGTSKLTNEISIVKAPHHGSKTVFDVKLPDGREVRAYLSLTIVPLERGAIDEHHGPSGDVTANKGGEDGILK